MTFDKARFYATVRTKLGRLSTNQVAGFEAVLSAIEGTPLSWAAFKLATTWHETNKTMEPVIEAYWLSETWRKNNLRYYPWYGQGYVQLTWERNYRVADVKAAAAGLINAGELIANPTLARRPDIAGFVLNVGCDEGWFTGVKCSSVLPATGTATRVQYMNSRTIINGRDKSDLIEDYCQVFERALRDGDWS
jgi:putative chitinase